MSEKVYLEDIAVSEDKTIEEETACCGSSSTVRSAYKNVYGLAFCFFANSCAYLGLQNIQSSVNKDAGLGLVSLSVLYVGYMASAIVTVGIVKSVGTRYTVIFGLVGYLVYMILNYYPSWYTLIPGSLAAGFGTGPIWIAGNCHVIALAEKMAPILKERKEVLVAKFLGTLYLAYQLSTPPGNIASSLILFYAEKYGNGTYDKNGTTNDGCGLLNNFSIEPIYFYILVSVYVFIQSVSIVGAFFFIDNTVAIPSTLLGKVKALMTTSTIKKVFDKRMLLLASIGFYCGLELSFPSGTFAQVYISDCLGVSKVGFILMIFGLSSGAVCFVYGPIVKYIPECFVLILSAFIQAGLVIFLLIWTRVPSYAAVIIFIIGWGAADAVWQISYSGFVAYLFPGDTTPAFGASRLWIGLGLTTGYFVSQLASGNEAVILGLLLGGNFVGTVFYLITLFTTKRIEQVFLFSVYCPKRVACPASEMAALSNENAEELDEECTNQSTSLPDDKGGSTKDESTV